MTAPRLCGGTGIYLVSDIFIVFITCVLLL